MTSGTQSSDSKAEQKRRDYRVKTVLQLRVRPVETRSAKQAGPDPVALYEELTLAQARFRKELGPAGRTFVDKLMATVDALTGLAVAAQGDSGWEGPFSVHADLSAGGIGFAITRSFEEGAEIEVEFSLPDAGSSVPFRCVAAVVRCQPAGEGGYDCGLSFIELSPTTQRRLVRVVLELQRVQLRNQGGEG
jgi:hypothetical protein